MADHFDDCSGNGSEACPDCGGEGFVIEAIDDMEDQEVDCALCDGDGRITCPGCAEASAHFEAFYDATTEGPLLPAAQAPSPAPKGEP